MGGKYYAVRVGRRPGIYEDWADVKALVDGYPGAQHKSFKSRMDAEAYLSAGPAPAAGLKRSRDEYGGDAYNEDADLFQAQRRSGGGAPCPSSRPAGALPRLPNHTYPAQQPVATLGILIAERPPAVTSGYFAADGYNRNASTGRPLGASNGGYGGSGSSRFSPVVEGPLQAIRSDLVYELEFDGASRGNPGEAGCGAVLRRADTKAVVCRLRKYMGSRFTNNEAEYTALLEGLRLARGLGVARVHAVGDSKLVVQQVAGRWQINKDHLRALCDQVLGETGQLREFQIRHVLREFNVDADKLSNDAIDLAYR